MIKRRDKKYTEYHTVKGGMQPGQNMHAILPGQGDDGYHEPQYQWHQGDGRQTLHPPVAQSVFRRAKPSSDRKRSPIFIFHAPPPGKPPARIHASRVRTIAIVSTILLLE